LTSTEKGNDKTDSDCNFIIKMKGTIESIDDKTDFKCNIEVYYCRQCFIVINEEKDIQKHLETVKHNKNESI
jgi:hypothetical protein